MRKKTHKEHLPEHRKGAGSHCELTEKAAIVWHAWQVEHNETTQFLAVISKNSSSENINCSKHIINASLTNRAWTMQLTTKEQNICVFTNSCAAQGTQVKLTILTPLNVRRKDLLARMCSDAGGGLAPNIKWLPLKIKKTKRKQAKEQNLISTVSSNYKLPQHNSLKNVTCLTNHPTLSASVELFVRCPFDIKIGKRDQCSSGMKKKKCIFSTADHEQIIQFNITGFVKQVHLECSKQNDSLPEGIELVKNRLQFKGPMKEHYAGIYRCVASYQHWQKEAHWKIEITSQKNKWFPTRAVLIAVSVIFAASACFCYVLRWHRRKQLVVIPQQYSVQNIGYQTAIDGLHCIKTQQDLRDDASKVNNPKDSQINTGSTNTSQETLGDVDVFRAAKQDNNAPEDSKQNVKSLKLDTNDQASVV
ncbi:uncharacterized protein LOC119977893 isoform X2 [Scyliorhinus canicula]|uniref:uncharacterized protein LOC119977893 isoform X2 n=1 Tax=Scyliorhinus canicula TaxID=7830 RepID=UPI0018F789A3|nr:uncharacterized protein LOC119977893 isoform X2 [Scyliorhinus canicula]